jgi:hypothetical protein
MVDSYNTPPTDSDGPNFSFELQDNDTTLSFIQKFSSKVYPENKMLVQNTTYSKSGYTDRPMTSHGIESIMSGGALSRHPVSALTAYNRLTNSSLEGQIAFASDWAGKTSDSSEKSFFYPSTNADPATVDDSKRFVTGSMAFQSAINKSILGTSYAPRRFPGKSTVLCGLFV